MQERRNLVKKKFDINKNCSHEYCTTNETNKQNLGLKIQVRSELREFQQVNYHNGQIYLYIRITDRRVDGQSNL